MPGESLLTDPEWSDVRTTAVALNSLKLAADQHRVSYDATKQRAVREKWPVGLRLSRAIRRAKDERDAAVVKKRSKALSLSVTSTSDAIAKQLAEENIRTKAGFSRAAVRVAEHASKAKVPKLLQNSKSYRDLAAIAGQVHGWENKAPQGAPVVVNVGILGR